MDHAPNPQTSSPVLVSQRQRGEGEVPCAAGPWTGGMVCQLLRASAGQGSSPGFEERTVLAGGTPTPFDSHMMTSVGSCAGLLAR